ncbi:uncharacterized protein LOC101173437 isoform X2 [Oryzias latipes]
MEQLHHLCFLVLLISLVGQRQTQPLPQNNTHATTQVTTRESTVVDDSSTRTTTNVPFSEVNSSLLAPTNATPMENDNSTEGTTLVPTSEGTSSTRKKDEASQSEETSPSSAPTEEPPPPPPPPKNSSSWGYVILVFIILIIIALSLMLFFIRRASRSYSFDLHRPSPMNNRNEPTGTFEAVYLDDFVANGSGPKSEENGSSGANDPQEQDEDKSVESRSASVSSQTLADSQDEKKASPPDQNNPFMEAAGEQENENNNNPSTHSSAPFVEINLNGPALCDQLLSPSESSTVQPFSIFSTSPTSSISSSS